MKQEFLYNSKILSYAIILNVFYIYIFSLLGFILNSHISIFYALFSFVFTILFLFLVNKNNNKNINYTMMQLGFYIIFFVISYFLALNFWDYSCDGRTYHQLGILLIKNGFNPIYEYNDILKYIPSVMQPKSALLQHCLSQPKFMEIVAANFYLIFEKIETGKLINYMLCIACFLYTYYTLGNFRKLSEQAIVLLTILFNFSPIILSQLQTYYVDGAVSIFFLLILLTIINIEKSEDEKCNYNYIFLLILSVIFINIKMSNLLYCFIIYLFYLIYLIFRKNYDALKKILLVCVSLFVLFLFTGINPYVTNIKQNHHIFYFLDNEYIVDSLEYSIPEKIKDKGKLQRFFISLFSPMQTSTIDDSKSDIIIKIPFTLDGDIIVSSPDIRLSGMGVFFSGILITSFLLLFALRFKNAKDKHLFIWLLSVIIVSTLLHPENWWARYVPQLWFLPLFIILFSLSENNMFLRNRLVTYLLLTIIFVNSFMFFVSSFNESYKYTKAVKAILFEIKSSKHNLELYIPNNDWFFEYSFFNKLYEQNITFYVINNIPVPSNCALTPNCINDGLYWNFIENDRCEKYSKP